ncbi:YidB family protein [Asticcacaulis sp. ZE23SCel15]|uniref:YidB family protein n=1 Tax=Asticcacaulis sp. ZE23SCel15 TaxID=3059027 RepID=UPI00265F74E5|nr:YidB family protein [Asticcacaulis sp. ZE23SCel15]WKL58967.1 YidB family protein [Asticcacaulis sp. ZE23SCel15]
MDILNGVLGALGGGDKGGLNLEALSGLVGNGGLNDIVGQLSQGGLQDVVQSWLGNGANLPISAEQIQAVLGSDQLAQIAQTIGVNPAQIADVLPGLIDKLSPNGQISAGGLGDIVGQLGSNDMVRDVLGGLFKR